MPCDYSRYPPNWKEISVRIRERENQRCKWCNAPNGRIVLRGRCEHKGTYYLDNAIHCNKTGLVLNDCVLESEYNYATATKIVLTVAHLGTVHPDGTPGDKHDKHDCRDENLAALCQRCHLLYDLDDHILNAMNTRDKKRGQECLNL